MVLNDTVKKKLNVMCVSIVSIECSMLLCVYTHHIWFVSFQLSLTLSPFFIHPLNSSPVSLSFHLFFFELFFFFSLFLCLHSTRFAYAVICLSWYYIWIYINLYTFYLSYHIISALQFYFRFRFIYIWIRFFSLSLLSFSLSLYCVSIFETSFFLLIHRNIRTMWANAIDSMVIVDARMRMYLYLYIYIDAFLSQSFFCHSILGFAFILPRRKLSCYLHQIPPIEFERWMLNVCHMLLVFVSRLYCRIAFVNFASCTQHHILPSKCSSCSTQLLSNFCLDTRVPFFAYQ